MSDSYSSEDRLDSDGANRLSGGHLGIYRSDDRDSDSRDETTDCGAAAKDLTSSSYERSTEDSVQSNSDGFHSSDRSSGYTDSLTTGDAGYTGNRSAVDDTRRSAGDSTGFEVSHEVPRDTSDDSFNQSSIGRDSSYTSDDTGPTTGFSSTDPASTMSEEEHAPETRFGISESTDPYSGSTNYGSGTTGGPGHGNKTAGDPDVDTSTTRLDSAHKTDSYTGGTEYGSGTTAGPGAGNKTAGSYGSEDSTMGKLMEKAGGLFKKDSLVEKGQEKRESAGYSQE